MSVSLKNVNESQSGQTGGEATTATPNYEQFHSEPVRGELNYVIFRLVKKKKGRVHIDGICDAVMNPKTQKRERIWLLNGADSIWQSELLELLKDKDYIKTNRRLLTFENGICRIPVHDDRALEFLRANTKNIGKIRGSNGKFDYYEYNPAQEQADRHKRQLLKLDMVVKAKEMPIEKVKKLASFLGISFIDELGMAKGDEGVRTELMLRADNDPENFAKYFDSPEVDTAYMVKKAILDAKIDLHAQAGNAIWANGKGLIGKIPAGRKPYEYLTELAMTNSDEGRRFKEQLQTFVN